jgi:hypothetical protein
LVDTWHGLETFSRKSGIGAGARRRRWARFGMYGGRFHPSAGKRHSHRWSKAQGDTRRDRLGLVWYKSLTLQERSICASQINDSTTLTVPTKFRMPSRHGTIGQDNVVIRSPPYRIHTDSQIMTLSRGCD